MNNNPNVFGANRRPIVEFALENVQALRKRTLKARDNDRRQRSDDGYAAPRTFKPRDSARRPSFGGGGGAKRPSSSFAAPANKRPRRE